MSYVTGVVPFQHICSRVKCIDYCSVSMLVTHTAIVASLIVYQTRPVLFCAAAERKYKLLLVIPWHSADSTCLAVCCTAEASSHLVLGSKAGMHSLEGTFSIDNALCC